ncbi:hypothetical protein GEU84_007125 [Fertoebacter nigrum]|uniref:Uncharacterized protein n=1 Tax=Fertoeibacter niger TaxID=2656921 RepID=A0A8X8GTQ1_9RHOB|nr:hypothetical protein [Fertoeibacter niger]NUB44148.1 hypothetical protein [Fertoeibacter niger]
MASQKVDFDESLATLALECRFKLDETMVPSSDDLRKAFFNRLGSSAHFRLASEGEEGFQETIPTFKIVNNKLVFEFFVLGKGSQERGYVTKLEVPIAAMKLLLAASDVERSRKALNKLFEGNQCA